MRLYNRPRGVHRPTPGPGNSGMGTDQILWFFLEQEFWTKITPEMHKQRGLGSICGCCGF